MNEPSWTSSRIEHVPQSRVPGSGRRRALFWSFFGVRRKSDYEKDAAQLNPVFVIIAGLLAAAFFVTLLIIVVNLVVP